MAHWRPSTRDDGRNARREFKRLRRGIEEANRPLGSSVYNTMGKMENIEGGEDIALPVGCVLFMTTQTNPANLGCRGTWTLKTQAFIPLTDDTVYYIYERTA